MPKQWVLHAICSALALTLIAIALGGATRSPRRLPPIVFVSRAPIAGDPLAVPGLGPVHRAVVTRGRLMLRESDGRVRELGEPRAFLDVANPAVSPDGRRVVFSAMRSTDTAWALFLVELSSGRVNRLFEPPMYGPSEAFALGDFEPCWISDSLLAFVRIVPWASQYPVGQVTELRVARLDPHGGTRDLARPATAPAHRSVRVSAERNGASEPVWDSRKGRLVYSRWWFNRWLPTDTSPGLTLDSAQSIARDTVNLWQLVSTNADGSDLRLAASGLTTRLESTGDQPAILTDGSIVAVQAANPGLAPRSGPLALLRFAPRLGHARRIAGAAIDPEDASFYGSARGLAAPSACAPAALPDGGVVFSYDASARGDFGLYTCDRDGRRLEKLFDLPGTHELDAAPVVKRAVGVAERDAMKRVRAVEARAGETRAWPPGSLEGRAASDTFRFLDRDVFAGGSARPGVDVAPIRTSGARIRFWATLASAHGVNADTAVLVHEQAIGRDGRVDARLPADVPLFEQLVDSSGRVLRTGRGFAHVRGQNSGRRGETVSCVGCHLGHSIVPVPRGN
ncbi:MAG: hypothetical protein HOP12_03635 [Candidatus Eisenbacteria bacterium]|uniref:Hydrazine synthase alpha subunit middle domain-containing protein n=1 Tax=Eiseniibacteriota bacterium TaxID=2212470 RepID=A0A849SI45_UNCEI|nr:hypothetical protein [Candidatus Eisenbacteria bacterium]